VPALADLVRGHPLFERYGLRPAALARSLSDALTRHDAIVVAGAPGGVVGFAWWTCTGAFARSPYLRLLVVGRAVTGAGVGGQLLTAVETVAFIDATDLFTLVSADNGGARRFYERRGYTEVGRLDDYVAPGLHEVVLRKRRSAAHRPTPPSGA